MAAFCFAYGAYIFAAGTDAARLTAGPVVFYLGSICIALYCTAATIIRQIIGTYTAAAKYLFPAIGYAFAVLTLVSGAFIISSQWPGALVTGHVVCGLGLITACVATAATSSTRFSLIPKNSADDTFSINTAGFTRAQSSLLIFIVSAIAAIAWVWCILLYVRGTLPAHIVAGSVMFGIACDCTSLIALVASIARQARGSYTMAEKGKWTGLVLTMGSLAFVLGLILIVMLVGTVYLQHLLGRIHYVDSGTGTTLSQEELDAYLATQPEEINTAPTMDPEDVTFPDYDADIGRDSDIINILLIGQDRREDETRARSDSMILCTFRKSEKKLTMTSFLRDTYVKIPGYGQNRINVAYAAGGMPLLNKTLENNFGVHIDGNVEVDFYQFADIGYLLGGV